jgi:hypothetical protein
MEDQKVEIGTTFDEPAHGQARAVQRRTAVWQVKRLTCDEILTKLQTTIQELATLKKMAETADEQGFWTEGERKALVTANILNGKTKTPEPATEEE